MDNPVPVADEQNASWAQGVFAFAHECQGVRYQPENVDCGDNVHTRRGQWQLQPVAVCDGELQIFPCPPNQVGPDVHAFYLPAMRPRMGEEISSAAADIEPSTGGGVGKRAR